MDLQYNYVAKLGRVVDGDTVDLDVDLGFHCTLHLRFRLLGVDTPERGHKDFQDASDALHRLFLTHANLDGYVHVESFKTGKYGRWLATISTIDGTVNFNEIMAKRWPGPIYKQGEDDGR